MNNFTSLACEKPYLQYEVPSNDDFNIKILVRVNGTPNNKPFCSAVTEHLSLHNLQITESHFLTLLKVFSTFKAVIKALFLIDGTFLKDSQVAKGRKEKEQERDRQCCEPCIRVDLVHS